MQHKLFWLGLTKFPMVGFLSPKLLELNDETVRVNIPININDYDAVDEKVTEFEMTISVKIT